MLDILHAFAGEVIQKEKETSEYVKQLQEAEARRDMTFKAVFEKRLNQENSRKQRAEQVWRWVLYGARTTALPRNNHH